MSGKSQRYGKELKLKAVKMYIEEGLSAIQIAKELEVTDKGRPRTRFDSPEEKMKYLEMKNEILKKRLAARWKGELPKFLK